MLVANLGALAQQLVHLVGAALLGHAHGGARSKIADHCTDNVCGQKRPSGLAGCTHADHIGLNDGDLLAAVVHPFLQVLADGALAAARFAHHGQHAAMGHGLTDGGAHIADIVRNEHIVGPRHFIDERVT
ncbi:hypothetical protein D3C72_2075140 [compost metagenome]